MCYAGRMPESLESLLPFIPLYFVAMWFGVTTLLAWLVGHPKLLARFPPVDEALSYDTSFASGRGPWMSNFNNALTVGVGMRGLHLAPNGLFRPFWWWGIPCVPWSEIVYVGERSSFLANGHEISIPSMRVTWTLYGAAGQAVAEAARTRGRAQVG